MSNLRLLETNFKLRLKYSLRADQCYSTYQKRY